MELCAHVQELVGQDSEQQDVFLYGLMVHITPWLYNAIKSGDVTFDTSTTTAINADLITGRIAAKRQSAGIVFTQ